MTTGEQEASIVRVWVQKDDEDIDIAGCGCLIAEKYVITCAHVVAKALHITTYGQAIPTDLVMLDFPLIEPGTCYKARVLDWQPPSADNEEKSSISELETDLAILELQDPLPDAAHIARPLFVNDLRGHPFEAFGFPASQDDDGVWTTGVLRAKIANGWIQMESKEHGDFFVQPGFSGTPVWDEQAQAMVGIVVSAKTAPYTKTAFMISIATFIKVWPTLWNYVDEDNLNYLRALYHQHTAFLPHYYPSNCPFELLRQRVIVCKKRVRWQEQDAKERESTRRLGSFKRNETLHQDDLERAYRLRHIGMYEPSEEDRKEQSEYGTEDWDEVRKRVKRGVILGDPGFGKSWLLRYEAQKVAKEQVQKLADADFQPDHMILPLFVRLTRLADELETQADPRKAIVEIVKREYDLPEHFVAPWLGSWRQTSSRLLLLLDGLDEVPSTKRERLREALHSLAATSLCRILLTSRIVGYGGPPFALEEKETDYELELVGFDAEQIQRFVSCWFTPQPTRGIHIQEKIRQHFVLRSLARIPLLLSFICLIGTDNDSLPTTRTKLYENVLHCLLEAKWRKNSAASPDSIEQKCTFLEKIAWHFAVLDGVWHDAFSPEEAYKVILETHHMQHFPQNISLAELSEQDGILIQEGTAFAPAIETMQPYRFIHRTLHEYLVARYLSKLEMHVWMEQIQKHLWLDSNWEVVIVLLAGSLKTPDTLLEMVLKQPYDAFHVFTLLAGRCLIEMERVKVKSKLVEATTNRLLLMAQSWSALDRRQATRVLGQISETKIIEYLYPQDPDWLARCARAEALGQLDDPRSLEGLLALRQDPVAPVREAAIIALGQKNDPRAISELFSALDEGDYGVRRAATKMLNLVCYERLIDTLLGALLPRDGQNEQSKQKQEALYQRVVELVRHTLSERTVITLANVVGRKDLPTEVRKMAAEVLGYSSDAQAIQTLLTVVSDGDISSQDAPAIEICKTALKALGQIGNPVAIEVVHSMLRDEHEDIRRVASDALISIAPSWSVNELLEALDGPDQHMRHIALTLLTKRREPGLVPYALRLLQDPREQWQTRHEMAHLLGTLGGTIAVQGLIAKLHDKARRMHSNTEKRIDEQAAEALGNCKDEQAVPVLLELLRDKHEDMFIRLRTAASLGVIGSAQAVEDLCQVLLDATEASCVRQEAAIALGKLEDPRGVEGLLSVLQQNDVEESVDTIPGDARSMPVSTQVEGRGTPNFGYWSGITLDKDAPREISFFSRRNDNTHSHQCRFGDGTAGGRRGTGTPQSRRCKRLTRLSYLKSHV